MLQKAKVAKVEVRKRKVRILQEESLELAAVVRQYRERKAESIKRDEITQHERNLNEQAKDFKLRRTHTEHKLKV